MQGGFGKDETALFFKESGHFPEPIDRALMIQSDFLSSTEVIPWSLVVHWSLPSQGGLKLNVDGIKCIRIIGRQELVVCFGVNMVK